MTRIYEILYNLIVANLLPFFLRGEVIQAFINSALAPLQSLQTTFNNEAQEIKEILKYDSRVIYLEKRLNDLYDPINRGIYITRLSPDRPQIIWQSNEGYHSYTYQISEGEHFYTYQIGESLATINFTVNIPIDATAKESQIIATTAFYNISGTQFNTSIY